MQFYEEKIQKKQLCSISDFEKDEHPSHKHWHNNLQWTGLTDPRISNQPEVTGQSLAARPSLNQYFAHQSWQSPFYRQRPLIVISGSDAFVYSISKVTLANQFRFWKVQKRAMLPKNDYVVQVNKQLTTLYTSLYCFRWFRPKTLVQGLGKDKFDRQHEFLGESSWLQEHNKNQLFLIRY